MAQVPELPGAYPENAAKDAPSEAIWETLSVDVAV